MPSNHIITLIVSLLYFGSICVYTRHANKEDKNRCNFTHWKLEPRNITITKNVSSELKKGTGEKQAVKVEVIVVGTEDVNVPYVTEGCCVGYEENRRGICKKCGKKKYGLNCSKACNCTRYKKCDHVTGECRRCLTSSCDEETDETEDSSTTQPSVLTTVHKVLSTSTTTTTGNIENITVDSSCQSCLQYNNCTKECNKNILLQTGNQHDDKDNTTTILMAVILSLAAITVLLIIGFVCRERRHRLKKKMLQNGAPVLFSALDDKDHEYVDPEPVYQEILDGDLVKPENLKRDKVRISAEINIYHTPGENVYKPPSDHTYSETGEIDVDATGYLNPYNSLKFARSETHLIRDKKLKEKGTYGSPYSLAQPVDNGEEQSGKVTLPSEKENERTTLGESDKTMLGESETNENDRLIEDSSQVGTKDKNRSSQNGSGERTSVPIYFVLAKEDQQQSQNSEQENLLKEKLVTSV